MYLSVSQSYQEWVNADNVAHKDVNKWQKMDGWISQLKITHYFKSC